MTPSRRREINEFAEQVRHALDLRSPIDMERVVRTLGGSVKYTRPHELPYEAIVEKKDGSFVISLTRDKAPTRRNFSIAHEVGHLLLHMGYIVDPKKWEQISNYEDSVRARYGYSEEELEANEFAGALLMPRDEFLKAAERHFDGEKYDVGKVAGHFGISSQAAKTRGQWLNVFAWD